MDVAEEGVDDWVRVLNTHLGRGAAHLPAYTAGQLVQELFGDVLEETAIGMTVLEVLFELQRTRQNLDTCIMAIRNWCRQDEIIDAYIEAEIRPGVQLTFLPNAEGEQKSGIMDVLADINGFGLNIYEPVRDAPQQLRLTHTYNTPGAARQRNILYSTRHYDRLEDNLHHHVIPAVEFQDPFALYRQEDEADEGTILGIAQEMKNVDALLFPEEKKLLDELHNLTGYDVEGKDLEADDTEFKRLHIEGLIALANVQGQLMSQQQAEQEYNKRKDDLERQIENGKKARKPKKTPAYLFQHFIKVSSRDRKEGENLEHKVKINPAMIGAALEQLALDNFPTITCPQGFKTYAPGKIRQAIFTRWEEGYVAFEVREDGLYGTKNEDEDFEKLLNFNGRKVERIEGTRDEGMASFYTRTPAQEEIAIYDDMLVDAKRLNVSDRAHGLIAAGKILFERRDALLSDEKKGIPPICILVGVHCFHGEYSDVKNTTQWYNFLNPKTMKMEKMWANGYDGVPLDQRLNNIHNSITQPAPSSC